MQMPNQSIERKRRWVRLYGFCQRMQGSVDRADGGTGGRTPVEQLLAELERETAARTQATTLGDLATRGRA